VKDGRAAPSAGLGKLLCKEEEKSMRESKMREVFPDRLTVDCWYLQHAGSMYPHKQKENTMRRILVSEMVTVDGFFAGTNGELDWFGQDEALDTFALDLLESVDTLLYGRVTYEMMAGFWPDAPGRFAERTNQLEKIVFTTTLKETPWGQWKNARPLQGNIVEEVAKLKHQTGRDMMIYGSGSIVQALTTHDFIDEYHLIVHPLVLGSGKPLFEHIKKRVKLSLRSTKAFTSGMVVLSYGLNQ